MNATALDSPAPVKRSRFVSGVGVIMILLGFVVLPISLISGLMLMAQSHGSQSATLDGFISVVLLPPLAIVAGFGLYRRKGWAYWLAQGILGWLILWNLWHELTTPSGTIYTSSSGVETIVNTPDYSYSAMPLILICLLVFIALLRKSVRVEFFAVVPSMTLKQAPTAGNQTGSPPSADIPRRFRAGSPGAKSHKMPHPVEASTPAAIGRKENTSWRGLAAPVASLFVFSVAAGWLILDGLSSGEVRSIARHGASLLSRAEDPGQYWLSIAVFGVLGMAAAVLGVWLVVIANSNRHR